MAVQLRQKFHRDVFIELNCYRKYGHNEGDEPAFTQPLEYQLIRKKASIRELYLNQLINQGVLEKQLAEKMEEEFRNSLQASQDQLKEVKDKVQESRAGNKHLRTEEHHAELFRVVETGVPAKILRAVSERFCTVPEGFSIHPKLAKLLEERLEMVAEDASKRRPIDWGMAEHLAMATLLWEGVHVRLTVRIVVEAPSAIDMQCGWTRKRHASIFHLAVLNRVKDASTCLILLYQNMQRLVLNMATTWLTRMHW